MLKWTDPDFPPTENSVFINPKRPPRMWPTIDEWKRITDISPDAKIFLNGIEPGDVIQGALKGMHILLEVHKN